METSQKKSWKKDLLIIWLSIYVLPSRLRGVLGSWWKQPSWWCSTWWLWWIPYLIFSNFSSNSIMIWNCIAICTNISWILWCGDFFFFFHVLPWRIALQFSTNSSFAITAMNSWSGNVKKIFLLLIPLDIYFGRNELLMQCLYNLNLNLCGKVGYKGSILTGLTHEGFLIYLLKPIH